MYRVTALKNGVLTKDVEEFSSEADVVANLRYAAPDEYLATVKEWMDGGATSPLTITESSEWADLWEYIP